MSGPLDEIDLWTAGRKGISYPNTMYLWLGAIVVGGRDISCLEYWSGCCCTVRRANYCCVLDVGFV